MKLTMQLGSRSYDIILKSGCLANLYQFANVANRKVFILTDSGVPEQYAQTVLAQCPNGMVYTVPQGEASKSLKVYGQVLQAMLEFNMTRKDLLVAVGGGVVGDLGGFCAAILWIFLLPTRKCRFVWNFGVMRLIPCTPLT